MLMPLWSTTARDIAYGPHSENRLDLSRPRWSGRRPHAAVLVFHGGGWARGSRDDMRERVCRRYLAAGCAVLAVDYRLGSVEAAAEDASRAVQWVRQNARGFGLDAGRIVLTGESAGGHLALLAGFQAQGGVAAIVNFYGPADLGALASRPALRLVLPAGDSDAVARLSPLTFVHPGLPPVLSIHGTADSTVPPGQSSALIRALKAAGNDAALLEVAGGSHGFSDAQQQLAYNAVFAFLRRRGILPER